MDTCYIFLPYQDMKIGIDVEKLVHYQPTLCRLLLLDPRGGYFLQSDVKDGIERNSCKPEYTAAYNALAMTKGLSRMQQLKKDAYVWRVMLSHVREKSCAYSKLADKSKDVSGHPQSLIDMYNMITPPRQPPTIEEPAMKPCAFIAFREKEEMPEASEPEDIPSAVMASFDYTEYKAVLLMSDGSHVPAQQYVTGPNERCNIENSNPQKKPPTVGSTF